LDEAGGVFAEDGRIRARDLGPAGYFDLGEVGALAPGARAMLLSCPHCGRQWLVADRALGVVALAARSHLRGCGPRSPVERRAWNAADEARWRRRRPTYPVVNDPDHPGVAGGVAGAARGDAGPLDEPPMAGEAGALLALGSADLGPGAN
jgi:hypothetical protein